MKTVILAGGKGTRMGSTDLPKAMAPIGGKPLLWHIMKGYAARGFTEFILCTGHHREVIWRYFAGWLLSGQVATLDFRSGVGIPLCTQEESDREPWRILLADTGEETMTGGRLKRVRHLLGEETFFLTYGDGLSDLDPRDVLDFHREKQAAVTLSAVRPPAGFGVLSLGADGTVQEFREKQFLGDPWINGGFMVMEPEIFDLIQDDNTVLERRPLETLAARGEMAAWRHDGFWQCMDTPADMDRLEKMWSQGQAPWKVWEEQTR